MEKRTNRYLHDWFGDGASIASEAITTYFAENQFLHAIKVSISAFYVSNSQILCIGPGFG